MSGWLSAQIQPQYQITKGRVVFRGSVPGRDNELRADYVLELSPGFPVAVVEAKREYAHAADGLQQAKEYAELLDLPVALSVD
jgi:type I restriction enzyme, R subunit